MNNHDGTFTDSACFRRGAAFGDINNDGKIDVPLLNVGKPPSLLLNHGVAGSPRSLQANRNEEQPPCDWRTRHRAGGQTRAVQ